MDFEFYQVLFPVLRGNYQNTIMRTDLTDSSKEIASKIMVDSDIYGFSRDEKLSVFEWRQKS